MQAAQPDPDLIYRSLEAHGHLALAVSGGSDSMALLRLAAKWGKAKLTVLTVDHGLRAASGQEVRQVAEWSRALGFACVILRWECEKPATGVQAKARAARYGLMSEWCALNKVPVLLTAHTLDDQAETVLMRLARTTSLDSLAGIPAEGHWGETKLLRPLLGERRAVLRAYLEEIGQPWIEDSSNADERFERVRIRKLLPQLAEIGLTPLGLAGVAKECCAAAAAFRKLAEDWIASYLREREQGYACFQADAFFSQPLEIQQRVLGQLIGRYGGGGTPVREERERLAQWMAKGSVSRTLGGALVSKKKGYFAIAREAGRIDPAPVTVPASGHVMWDGRFMVWAPAGSKIVPAHTVPGFVSKHLLWEMVRRTEPAVWLPDGTVTAVEYYAKPPAHAEFRPKPD